jgi:putative hydrolase
VVHLPADGGQVLSSSRKPFRVAFAAVTAANATRNDEVSTLGGVEPVEALERIAYLLDRAREKSYRVRAYQRAAEAIGVLSPDELRDRIAAGTLTELEGVGPKTASIVEEVVATGTTSYLGKLETDTAVQTAGGDALRSALKGDCHVHSTWSDGGADIRTMAYTAQGLGHEYLVLTDHSPRLTIANGLTRERLEEQLALVAELNAELAPFRILTGIEVDILDDGALDQDDDILAALDVVVASVHSKLRMPEPEMTRRMATAVANPHVDILGHCTNRIVVGRGRPESTFDAELVFHACSLYDTAVEINSRPERLDPPRRLLDVAIESGCRFAIDTDAHAPGQLEWQAYGCDRAAERGVTADRVVNTWSADELTSWAAAHDR